MAPPQTLGAGHAAEAARQLLADMIHQACGAAEKRHGERRAIRLEAPIESLDLVAWLRVQGNRSRGYWAGRDGDWAIAGRGTADVITADVETDYDDLIDRLRAGIAGVHPNLRYYGGMRFTHGRAADIGWKPFGAYRFVLPRFELIARGAQTYLACNAVFGPECDVAPLRDEILDELRDMTFPEEREAFAPPPPMTGRVDEPEFAGWDRAVNEALDVFHAKAMEKVVLARRTRFAFAGTLDGLSLFMPLLHRTPRAYHFCFQPRPDHAFLGASPERLYRRQGRFLESEAVAGTRPRGETPAEDEALARELLEDPKELREHQFVVDGIRAVLERFCTAIHVDPAPAVMKQPKVQHLHTRIEGILRDGVDHIDADLLRTLHPTAAVGGVPRDRALAFIASREGFDRGWYAGPVGWIGSDAAEFAVAIRSGIVDGDTLSLYSGAGIVEGSAAAAEWGEIEQKMSNFLGVLTGG